MPAPLIAAGFGAAGSLLGGLLGNQGSRLMAREQMNFQEHMSNTAYQRAMTDMRLAGINPMLAFMQGGASSPSGASATMNDVISPAVSSAQHGVRLEKELKLLDEQKGLVADQAHRQRVETGLMNTFGPAKANAEVGEMLSRRDLNWANARAANALLPLKGLTGSLAGGLRPFVDMAGEGFRSMHGVLRGVQSGADQVRRAIWDTGAAGFRTLRPSSRR